MQTQSNYIFIKDLYEFVRCDYYKTFRGNNDLGRKYSRLVSKITSSIPEKPGFYLWGSYNEDTSWNNIYVGKAGSKKSTNLRNRIKEELKDERQFLWLKNNDEETIDEIGLSNFPEMWEKEYRRNTQRALKKFNSTYIIWVSYESMSESLEQDISDIESNLIDELGPTANSTKPSYNSELKKHSNDVIQHFMKYIHKNRIEGCRFIPKKKNSTST